MACIVSTFCVSTNFYAYDGEYDVAGTYNSEDYFTGGSYFIYFSTIENRWCLSDSLGGTCYQFGPTGSFLSCPDLDESFFSSGACPTTTTTTTSPCDVFDFEAIFDCLVPTTTTTSTTIPPTTTTTTTIFNLCDFVAVDASINTYTTTTTTILPTTTTTTTINRPCNFDGNAQFNIFDEYMRCGNSKKFKDCLTGIDYYSSDVVLSPFGISPTQGYVYKANVNGVSICVTFVGLVETTSGVDNISLIEEIGLENEGGCLECLPDPPPPTTTTTSTSTTTTTTIPPCILSEYLITNNNFLPAEFRYTDCDGNTINDLLPGNYGNKVVCSPTVPNVFGNATIQDTGFICN